MLRWLTSGESHGPALVGILEGLPADVEVQSSDIQEALARRRLGYGRGARMKFEQDEVRLLGGVRHGRTQGGPVAIEIGNTEWPKWVDVMSSDPVEDPDVLLRARNAPLTRPRPGHADLVGMRKYAFDDARPVLERASARETATRVALGTVAARFLEQAAGVRLVSHVVSIGPVVRPGGRRDPDARRHGGARRRPGALLRRGHVGRDGRGDRPVPQGRRHARRRRRGARVRAALRARVVRALRPSARRAARGRAHGHPGHQGRRGGRRVPHRRPARVAGARRDRAGRAPAGSCAGPTAPAGSRAG